MAAQTPPPIKPLDRAAVRRGLADVRIASVAEGLAGEMIFSQNCYDALAHRFTWAKLDVCGAFDAGAASALGDGEQPGLEKEVAWFQSEAAAGRYLKAASAAGAASDAADARHADLQSRAAKAPLRMPKLPADAGSGNEMPPAPEPAADGAGVPATGDRA